jgi:DNA-binding MarR family transcriptional regulator
MEISQARQQAVIAVITAGAALQRRLDGPLGNIKGITYSEHQLLAAIAASPTGCGSRVDLARAVGLTPSGVTRALRPLEKLGMVTTTRDERDARRSLASLTDDGERLLADATGVLADAIEAMPGPADLPAGQAQDLVDTLARLLR